MANNLMEMFRPQPVYTPTDAMRDVGNAKNALASGQLTSMKANALGQEMADNEAINQVMTANGGDLNSAMQDPNLNWKAKQQIGGMISEQNKAQADSQMKRVESQIKNWQYAGNRVGSAQSQEDWDAAREEVRSVLGDDFAKNLPEQWSPEVAKRFGDAAMTHAEKIAQQREERQANYQNQSLDLQERRLQNAENRGSGGGMDAQDKGWEVKETAGGLVRVNKYTGEVVPVTMGGQTVQGKPKGGGVATEDERKAAGWASQMELAKSQINNILKSDPSASDKGVLEALAPGELLSRQAMSENRKRYVDAVSSLSEAALRAATGAGINESEAKQKIAELSPVFGDSEAIIADKMARMDMYIQSVTGRAGRAQDMIVNPESQATTNTPTTTNW